jgi:hypothetical protein
MMCSFLVSEYVMVKWIYNLTDLEKQFTMCCLL